MEIFFEGSGEIDLRAMLGGRGDAIEAGLSVVDTDLPIAGLGSVDLIGIDGERRLVIIDIAGRGETAALARIEAQARWFRENLPIVRRMYQIWNVSWDLALRAVCVLGADAAEAERAGGGHPGREEGIERIVARLIRTRQGREALLLSAPGARSAAGPQGGIAEAGRSPSPKAAPSRPTGAIPGGTRATAVEATGGERVESSRIPGRQGDPARGEAYRRELGLTPEEFAEFFAGAKSPARPDHREGLESGMGPRSV